MSLQSLLVSALLAKAANAAKVALQLAPSVPSDASLVLPKDYLSFSIETSSFSDYGGNFSAPNNFTRNLLENFADETGVPIIVRIGGATGDHISYVADQEEAYIPYWDYSWNKDQPRNATIGPAWWESLAVIDNVRYIYQLNAYQNDSMFLSNLSAVVNNTINTVGDRLHLFEVGNELDGAVSQSNRPAGWTMADYTAEWRNKTRHVNAEHENQLRWMAPSFSSVNPSFLATDTFNDTMRINEDGWITEVSQHNYIAGSQNRITLQQTLMNHSTTISATRKVLAVGDTFRSWGYWYSLGETNSIYGQGAASISDVFGAALWNVDFCLHVAASNVQRVYMHQGTSYRYASWLPVNVNGTGPIVKPPYYGNIFVARFVGKSGKTRVAEIPREGSTDHVNIGYAAYDDGKLARITLMNLLEYNATRTNPETGHTCKVRRTKTTFTFAAPPEVTTAKLAWLEAGDAHSKDDITFDGYQYSYENGEGLPVKVKDSGEVITAQDGVFSVDVPESAAVLVDFA